jgi:molybdopterin converting factor small subunit
MTVTLRLPSVLKVAVGADQIKVTWRTVGEAFEAACAALPQLRQHVLLPSGELRPHVLCLVNGRSLPRAGFGATPLEDGDEILVHQAISGG